MNDWIKENVPESVLARMDADDMEALNNACETMDDDDLERVVAVYNGYASSIQEAIDALEDSTVWSSWCDDWDLYDLGCEIVDSFGGASCLDKETLELYFNYKAFARDCCIENTFIPLPSGGCIELY